MSRIFKRRDAKNYFVWIKLPEGKWVKRNTLCADKKSAEAAARTIERDAYGVSGETRTAKNQATLGDALDALVRNGLPSGKSAGTVRMWAQKGGHLVRLLGRGARISGLTIQDLEKYRSQRYAEGAALSTLSKELLTLRAAIAPHRPDVASLVPKVKFDYVPRSRFLTWDELWKLIAELEPHHQLWVLVAVFTGGRYSEVARLEWSDIQWSEPASVHLRGKKTRRANRRVPLHPLLNQCLSKVKKMASGPIVGAWPNARRDLHAACKRAKVLHISPNDLRRTFASWMKQRGVDSAAVAALLGHSSTKMVDMVYGQLDAKTLSRAVATIPGGKRDTNGMHLAPLGELGEPLAVMPRHGFSSETKEIAVLGDRIELSTRGFSVRTHDDVDMRFVERLLNRGGSAGYIRDVAPARRLMGRAR